MWSQSAFTSTWTLKWLSSCWHTRSAWILVTVDGNCTHACTGEYPRHDLWQIKEVLDNCKALFPATSYAQIGSSLGFGQQGIVLASMEKVNGHSWSYIYSAFNFMTSGVHINWSLIDSLVQKTDFNEPLRKVSEEEADRMGLNYYDSDVHRSCFIWPRYVKKVIYAHCMHNYIMQRWTHSYLWHSIWISDL